MYIKFCRIAGSGVNAKLPHEANATFSVEVKEQQEKDLQVLGNVGLYRAVCLLLSVICLVLLLVIIILCVKFPLQPQVCHGTEKGIEAKEKGSVTEKGIEAKEKGSVTEKGIEAKEKGSVTEKGIEAKEKGSVTEKGIEAKEKGSVTEKGIEAKEERFQSTEVCSLKTCQAQYFQQQSQVPACHMCDEGWLHFESSCYFLSRDRMNWDESRDECKKRGADLAIITNKTVQTFLTKKGNLMYWIGLRQRTRNWVWVNNTALGQSYWSGSNRQGDCGLLTGRDPPERSWSSSSCDQYSFYICQRGR
ncbi:C-type lectin domain family 10 member A-like isoform X3 [Salvelinus namaycush]|uniref:C-type lectin domain family 10 member A-like isoform X2 n=1 Tax=Salvelinus namaycush TaxID=8040 RepID=A0A8U0PV10_SALNM|nr:C-type lectin domain family 10 member A-like isoform X2 [Salvelinus namaycush]XP_038832586.1 C-type lectin domain family 10 member A-like isoform X3 [Salvelinus namaycush]